MKKIIMALAFAFVMMFCSNNYVGANGLIIGPSTIHKEANQIFTIIDLLSLYDPDVFIEQDNYTGYGNMAGEYTVTLKQGTNTKQVHIIVVDSWGDLQKPNDLLFVTDQKNIYVSSDRQLTLYEIIYYIYSKTNYVETGYSFRYEELNNEYHNSIGENGNIPAGSYTHDFKLTYYSGEQVSLITTINVVDLPEIAGVILTPPPTTIDKAISMIPFLLVIGVPVYLFTNRKRKRGFN